MIQRSVGFVCRRAGLLVTRRHMIYVPGYDSRGVAAYFRMFRTQLRQFRNLYGVRAAMSKVESPDNRRSARWTIKTTGADWQVDTEYEFLRWEDIVLRDFERSDGWAILAALHAFWSCLRSGWIVRIFRAHWRFGLFAIYPFMLLLCWTLLSALAGWLVAGLTVRFTEITLVPELFGLATATLVFVTLFKLTETRTYMIYLFQDMVSTPQYARGQRPDWEERLEIFAGYVVEAARAGTADEIVIVGHSSGSFLAVSVLARALARDPQLGRCGARVVLLTVGGNLPILGFQPEAGWFREQLALLAVEDSIDWIDYQSRKDVMNFYPFDPIAGHGIDVQNRRVNPKVVAVRFRDIVSPKKYSWLRWHLFSLHFQFLMANERPAAYDYFMIVGGPFSLALRVTMPHDVTAAVSGDGAAIRAAWERIRAHANQEMSSLKPRTADLSSVSPAVVSKLRREK